MPLLPQPACLSVPDLGPRPEPRAGNVRGDGNFAATADAPAAVAGRPLVGELWRPRSWPLVSERACRLADHGRGRGARSPGASNAQQAGAALQPSIEATASGGAVQVSENLGLPVGQGWDDFGQIALGLTFDLDLWGRNRANLRAALSEADAARADAAYARLTLSTAIADPTKASL